MTKEKEIRSLAEKDLTQLLDDSSTPFCKLGKREKDALISLWIRGYEACDSIWVAALKLSAK